MGNFIDLTGRRFGKLTVIERAEVKAKEALWLCKCDCGKTTLSRSSSLRTGKSQSCGCSRLDHLIESPPRKTHGGSSERLFRVWRGMIDRCYYSSHNRYKNYGARGITICNEWRHNYQAFKDWALKNGYNANAPRGKYTIDRVDVDGSYCPENCRWVSMKVQANNKRNSKGA